MDEEMLKIYERLQGEIAAMRDEPKATKAPSKVAKEPKAAAPKKRVVAADLAAMETPEIEEPVAPKASRAPKAPRAPRAPRAPKAEEDEEAPPKAPKAPRAPPKPKAAPKAPTPSNTMVMNAPVRVGRHTCVCEVCGKSM